MFYRKLLKQILHELECHRADGKLHGHWILLSKKGMYGGGCVTQCSVCNQKLTWANYRPNWWGKFCRNCGACMDEPIEDRTET